MQPEAGVFSVHEPHPTLQDIGHARWAEALDGRSASTAFLHHRKAERRAMEQASVYVESNGGLTFLVDDLHRRLRSMRVLHVIRSPLSFIRSGVSRIDAAGLQRYAADDAWLFRSSDKPSDPWYERWDRLDIYERFAWIWRIKNQHLADWCARHENGRTIRFEDLFQTGPAHDEAIAFASWGHVDRLDVSERINPSSTDLASDLSTWPAGRIETIDAMTGELADRFGYPMMVDRP